MLSLQNLRRFPHPVRDNTRIDGSKNLWDDDETSDMSTFFYRSCVFFFENEQLAYLFPFTLNVFVRRNKTASVPAGFRKQPSDLDAERSIATTTKPPLSTFVVSSFAFLAYLGRVGSLHIQSSGIKKGKESPSLIMAMLLFSTTSVPKYKYLLTSVDHVWAFVLFKKFVKILFILLWHVLSRMYLKYILIIFIFS